VSSQRKIRVAVVFGGRGPEHAVSVMGGGNMLSSIDRSKYEVIPIGITREGSWVQVADEPGLLAISGGELPSVEAAAVPGAEVVPWAGGVSPGGRPPGTPRCAPRPGCGARRSIARPEGSARPHEPTPGPRGPDDGARWFALSPSEC